MKSKILWAACAERSPAFDHELPSDDLREYTQVIIKEADRLQGLVDQMLAPHRKPKATEAVNIHEVCERVRSLMLAEFPSGLSIQARLRH
jgi:two-component system, NtrC family, nitrogen regulation sensor histidine kinase GlnL